MPRSALYIRCWSVCVDRNESRGRNVEVPVWVMSAVLIGLMGYMGIVGGAAISTYVTVSKLVDRVAQVSDAQYITVDSVAQMLARRDDRIEGLRTLYLDLRDQVRQHHPRTGALHRPRRDTPVSLIAPLCRLPHSPPTPPGDRRVAAAVLPKTLGLRYGSS